MKLADLRKKLRRSERAPVDELDDFLISKGTMAPRPDPVDVSGPIMGGRKADVVIVDDPIKESWTAGDVASKKMRADFRKEIMGEWIDEPPRGSLPPSLDALLMNGVVVWDNTQPNRIAGQVLYDRMADDLCEIKGPAAATPAGVTAALVWRGERHPDTGQPILRTQNLDELFAIKTYACGCGGPTFRTGRRGPVPPCKRCDGLGRLPTRDALAPFRKRDDR